MPPCVAALEMLAEYDAWLLYLRAQGSDKRGDINGVEQDDGKIPGSCRRCFAGVARQAAEP